MKHCRSIVTAPPDPGPRRHNLISHRLYEMQSAVDNDEPRTAKRSIGERNPMTFRHIGDVAATVVKDIADRRQMKYGRHPRRPALAVRSLLWAARCSAVRTPALQDISIGNSCGLQYPCRRQLRAVLVGGRLSLRSRDRAHEAVGVRLQDDCFCLGQDVQDRPDPSAHGMGLWTRKQAEICLLGTKGKVPRRDKGVRQVIMAPRREHSRKPDEVYPRIERLVDGNPTLRCSRGSRAQAGMHSGMKSASLMKQKG